MRIHYLIAVRVKAIAVEIMIICDILRTMLRTAKGCPREAKNYKYQTTINTSNTTMIGSATTMTDTKIDRKDNPNTNNRIAIV